MTYVLDDAPSENLITRTIALAALDRPDLMMQVGDATTRRMAAECLIEASAEVPRRREPIPAAFICAFAETDGGDQGASFRAEIQRVGNWYRARHHREIARASDDIRRVAAQVLLQRHPEPE